jgi:hypothetical protein
MSRADSLSRPISAVCGIGNPATATAPPKVGAVTAYRYYGLPPAEAPKQNGSRTPPITALARLHADPQRKRTVTDLAASAAVSQ